MNSGKDPASGKHQLYEEQRKKINQVRALLGPLSGKSALYCSDASIARYLVARNWNLKKATKMLKESLKWRSEYKPEEIRWDEVAKEAETGKIYRTSNFDKFGRSVLVMRPRLENTKSAKGQVRYLVYCMENAILNLPPGQQQMVWLIDFHGFNLAHLSLNVTKDTAHVLQGHYPERLGVAILYNPPKIFESFWNIARLFLEPKTYRKVKFVYSNDANSMKMLEDLFDMDELEKSFGGNREVAFDVNEYGVRMREDDKKMPAFWSESSHLGSEPFTFTDESVGYSDLQTESEMEDERQTGASAPKPSSSLNGGSALPEITRNSPAAVDAN